MLPKPKSRRLFLLRHALAMSPVSGSDDFARILSPKGLEDAGKLGRVMVQKNYLPDLILCSTATRARQTLDRLMQSLPKTETHYIDKLYDGGTDSYVREVQKIQVKYKSVLLVGHNPCIYEYAASIAGKGRDSLLQRLTEGYKPATLSALNCDVEDWALLSYGEGELIDILDPLQYNAADRPTRWM